MEVLKPSKIILCYIRPFFYVPFINCFAPLSNTAFDSLFNCQSLFLLHRGGVIRSYIQLQFSYCCLFLFVCCCCRLNIVSVQKQKIQDQQTIYRQITFVITKFEHTLQTQSRVLTNIGNEVTVSVWSLDYTSHKSPYIFSVSQPKNNTSAISNILQSQVDWTAFLLLWRHVKQTRVSHKLSKYLVSVRKNHNSTTNQCHLINCPITVLVWGFTRKYL